MKNIIFDKIFNVKKGNFQISKKDMPFHIFFLASCKYLLISMYRMKESMCFSYNNNNRNE